MNLAGALLIAFSVANPTTYEEKINEARERFYEEKYEEAQRVTLVARSLEPSDPESYELSTTVMLFQLKKITGIDGADEQRKVKKTLTSCRVCPELLRQFENDSTEGIRLARHILSKRPDDERAMFLLAKIDLNRLWLFLQILDKMKGWREYQEARKLLVKLLARNPNHVRALTALAWINYIVAERNFLLRAILGGGSKKTAYKQLHHAAACVQCDFFDRIEAKFSLFDILRQEKRFAEALVVAEELSARFPENASFAHHVGQKSGEQPRKP